MFTISWFLLTVLTVLWLFLVFSPSNPLYRDCRGRICWRACNSG
ncbi:hypothetical protein MGSAQ_002420 [marine sediment metagenome]|uniref:Uncharacterized protein n=1 Tax=marine sediment metagenome TaxID=412755 RepID=A0A1B6NRT9_9ZZZZ